jgi:conjugative transfer signal peptidase TraF
MMSHAAVLLVGLASTLLIAEPALHDNSAALIWNASASLPIGLYRLTQPQSIEVGDIVVVQPPEPLAGFLAARGYLPRGVPLMKRVQAVAGAVVCRVGLTIIVDGHVVGTALQRDSHNRPLPVWQGCKMLVDGDIFLMNTTVADSFDGRYFGPLPATTVTARALPVLTDDGDDGHFHWHIGDRSGTP